jgi:hypothetical protein
VPIYPLEGNAPNYKEFATGPIAWRVAPLIPERIQPTVRIVDAAYLETYPAAAPPAAILTGGETSVLEQALNDYARKHSLSNPPRFGPLSLGPMTMILHLTDCAG